LFAQYMRALSPTANPLVDGDPIPIAHVNPSRVIDVTDSAVIVPDSRTCSVVVPLVETFAASRIDALTAGTLPTSPTSASAMQVTVTLSPRAKPAVAGELAAISQRSRWWRLTTAIDAGCSETIRPLNTRVLVELEAIATALAKPRKAIGTSRRRRIAQLSARHSSSSTLD
jgi:hypothetical protein